MRRLVRKKTLEKLYAEGYHGEIEKKKGKQFKFELCSLFLAEYKETLYINKPNQLKVHYADMLEIIRTLMVASKINIKEVVVSQNQPMEWYRDNSPSKQKLKEARIDLLQKFDEFLQMKTEAVRDQLKDMFESFKRLVADHKLSFVQIEQTRRVMFEKLGGFQGDYLKSVSKIKTSTTADSV